MWVCEEDTSTAPETETSRDRLQSSSSASRWRSFPVPGGFGLQNPAGAKHTGIYLFLFSSPLLFSFPLPSFLPPFSLPPSFFSPFFLFSLPPSPYFFSQRILDFGARQLSIRLRLRHSWTTYFPSLSFSFLICKMRNYSTTSLSRQRTGQDSSWCISCVSYLCFS